MKRFNSIGIRTQLLAAFMFISLIGLALGVTGLISIYTLTGKSSELSSIQAESFGSVPALNSHFLWRQEITEAVLTGNVFTGSVDPNTCPLSRWLEHEGGKSITDESILSILHDISAPHEIIHRGGEVISDFLHDGDTAMAEEYLFNTVLPKSQEVITGLTHIENRYNERSIEITKDIVDTGSTLSVLIVMFILIAVVACILLTMFFPPIIVKPLLTLSSTMAKATDGDFTVRLPHGHGAEMGKLFDACNALIDLN